MSDEKEAVPVVAAVLARSPGTYPLTSGNGIGKAPVFSGTEYHVWAKKMRAFLRVMFLWEVVERPIEGSGMLASIIGDFNGDADTVSSSSSVDSGIVRFKGDPKLLEKAAHAGLILLMAMKSGEASALLADVPEDNAHEMWRRLEAHYDQRNEASISYSLSELANMKQRPTEPVAAYIARMKQVVLSLQMSKVPVERHNLNYKFLTSLNPSFDHARTAIQASENYNSKTFDQVCNYILGQESHNALRRLASKDSSGSASAHAVQTNGTSSGECFTCGKPGHQAKNCRSGSSAATSKSSSAGNKKGEPQRPLCTWCKKGPHTEANCYDKRDGKPSASAGKGSAASMSAEAYGADMKNTTPSSSTRWILDSGASRHMASSSVTITDGAKVDTSIRVANGEILNDPTAGAHVLQSSTNCVNGPITLKSVLVHDGMKTNLLSVSSMCDSPDVKSVVITKGKAQVLGHDGRVLIEAHAENGLYVVNSTSTSSTLKCCAACRRELLDSDYSGSQLRKQGKRQCMNCVTKKVAQGLVAAQTTSSLLMHARLAHMSHGGMERLLKVGTAVGGLDSIKLSLADFKCTDLCKGCIQGKAHRKPFNKDGSANGKSATRPLGRVHFDIAGPMHIPSLSGARYLLIGVDEYCNKPFGWIMKEKSQAESNIIAWYKSAAVQQGKPAVEFHSDGGGEFNTTALHNFFKENGITWTMSTPHTPQHNAVAERMIRTVMEAARAMLTHAGAPLTLWAEAVMSAIKVRGVVGTRKGATATADMLWNPAVKPSLDNLKVWGCDAWMHIPDADRQKLDAKAKVCIFLGYDELDHQAYRLYNVAERKFYRSRDVRFDEFSFTQCKALAEADLRATDGTAVPKNDDEFYNWMEIEQTNAETEMAIIASRETARVEAEQRKVVASPPVAAIPLVANVVPPPVIATVVKDSSPAVIPDAAPPPAAPVVEPEAKVDDVPIVEHKEADDASKQPDDVYRTRSGRAVIRPWSQGRIDYTREVGANLAQLAAENDTEPVTVHEALRGPESAEWTQAMKDEVASLIKHGTWVPATLPPGRKAIGTRFVYKKKIGAFGKVVRYKSRVVAKGYAQREGVDYHATFAPVLGYATLRAILAVAAELDLEVDQLDVETAFLYAKIEEEVYITMPPGLEAAGIKVDSTSGGTNVKGTPNVYRLIKSLYGVKQAPRDWNTDITGKIEALGYKRIVSDACVYVKISRTGKPIIVPLFVDDMFPSYHRDDRDEWNADKAALMTHYTIKDMGEAHLVLGMRVTRDRKNRTLKLDQEVYINKIIANFHMQDCVPADTPSTAGVRLSNREREVAPKKKNIASSVVEASDELDTEFMDTFQLQYGSLVGSLLYAALSTRPDIAHAVSVLARFVSNPLYDHWVAAKHLLRYLKGTAHLGLTFRGGAGNGDTVVLGPCFSDADWAGDVDDRKSTSGVVCSINGCAVAWKSKKQDVVAQSSAEAEYIAMGDATKMILWLRQLLFELGLGQVTGTVLLGDNKAALMIAQNPVSTAAVRHIDMRYHLIRDHVKKGHIVLQWVPSEDQQGDILTKSLGKHPFKMLSARVMGDGTTVGSAV